MSEPMTNHPILFNTEMVRAILDGRKVQSRRPVKRYSRTLKRWITMDTRFVYEGVQDGRHQWYDSRGDMVHRPLCLFGVPGDLLYVRETCKMFSISGIDSSATNPTEWTIKYRAGKGLKTVSKQSKPLWFHRWTPSIHMPRWASRLTLRVKRVWVERVQSISATDALFEGTPGAWIEQSGYPSRLVENPNVAHVHFFSILWDSIYAKKNLEWAVNPYVWAAEFERVE